MKRIVILISLVFVMVLTGCSSGVTVELNETTKELFKGRNEEILVGIIQDMVDWNYSLSNKKFSDEEVVKETRDDLDLVLGKYQILFNSLDIDGKDRSKGQAIIGFSQIGLTISNAYQVDISKNLNRIEHEKYIIENTVPNYEKALGTILDLCEDSDKLKKNVKVNEKKMKEYIIGVSENYLRWDK